MADVEPSPNRGVMIVLAYLWPLALVPLLLEKHDPEVQWHAKHGIVLMIAAGSIGSPPPAALVGDSSWPHETAPMRTEARNSLRNMARAG